MALDNGPGARSFAIFRMSISTQALAKLARMLTLLTFSGDSVDSVVNGFEVRARKRNVMAQNISAKTTALKPEKL